MANVTAAMVKELRERTGLGMMDCRNALAEADGDMELAIETLRKSSALKAAKKAGRTAADGLLGMRIADDGRTAALIEVNIETDFAAKNEKFIAFVGKLTDALFAREDGNVAALAAEVEAERQALVQEIGENITVRRGQRIVADGHIYGYLHGDQRRGALVALSGANETVGKDVAMHITATAPMVVNGSEVPADVLEREREIYTSQAAESGKPADIVAKMVEGRVRKFLAEVSLVDQPFVKNDKETVGALLKSNKLTCTQFVRYEVGEGIEKEAVDFAAEVAAQVKGSA